MSNKRDALMDEARARLERGDHAGSGRSLRKLLRLRPADGEGLYLLGALQLQEGKVKDAGILIRRALDCGKSPDPAVLENLGTACLMSGDAMAAERELRRAIAAGGTRSMLHMRLGMALAALGRLDEAEAALRVAQQLDPEDADIGINLGNVLASGKRTAEALEQFRQVLERNPGHADALYNIGTLHRETGRFEEAIEAYLQTLAVIPDHVDALNNLGTIRENTGKVAEAVELYRKALAIEPGSVRAYSNLASAFRKQGFLEEAAQSCQKALDLEPGFVDALVNLGGLRAEQGQFEEAKRAYQQAWENGDPEARCHYDTLRLALGEFSGPWPHYQLRGSRRQVMQVAGVLDSALPDNIEGMNILIFGEQGIGDELFFLRCAAVLKEKKARLICVCDPKIRTLLERTALFDTVLTYGEPLPSRDLTFVAGDLPVALRCGQTLADPASLKPLQLTPLPARVQAMQNYLDRTGPPPYLAVTWRSGTPATEQRDWNDRLLSKEVPLDVLAPALEGFRGTIISLQRNPGTGETARLAELVGDAVYDASAINGDLEDLLALLSLLHEYVGVSNTNMHLMAGLGGRARVILQNPPEWRWMAAGDASPWFPRFVLYRQAVDRTWNHAMAGLRADLTGAVHG